jgi:hypothetical protein
MESAVLEPTIDEQDKKWQEIMEGAGLNPDAPPVRVDEDGQSTLEQALGLPESFEDLWPGHVYIPPKLKQLRTLIPLAQSIFDKLGKADNVLEAFDDAVTFVKFLARRQDDYGDLYELNTDEIEERFDEEEIARIINHIMLKQGLVVEEREGNASSGRSTGLKNFVRFVATIADTDSSIVEN